MNLKVGVSGLGIMGGAFANNLARNGFNVTGYDPSKVRSNIFKTPLIPKIQKFKQIVNETGSDSSALDNMIEILVSGGIDIFKSIRMVLPPAWQNAQLIDPDVKSFHEYNSMHMEPWDGPAGLSLIHI